MAKNIYCIIARGNPDNHPGHKEYNADKYFRLTYIPNPMVEYGFDYWFATMIRSGHLTVYDNHYWHVEKKEEGLNELTWFIALRHFEEIKQLAKCSYGDDLKVIESKAETIIELKPLALGEKILCKAKRQNLRYKEQLSLF